MNDRWGRRLYNTVSDLGSTSWNDLAPQERAIWNSRAEHFISAVIPNGNVVIEQDRLSRLVAAASKLRRFSRSIVGYGGNVPESEALTDSDLAA